MSWHNHTILDVEDIAEGTAVELPANLQVGADAKLWLGADDGTKRSVPAVVVGVRIAARHAIYYDLAFKIEGTDLYAVVRDIRGWVTDAAATDISEGGGLVDAGEIASLFEATPARPRLTVVRSEE